MPRRIQPRARRPGHFIHWVRSSLRTSCAVSVTRLLSSLPRSFISSIRLRRSSENSSRRARSVVPLAPPKNPRFARPAHADSPANFRVRATPQNRVDSHTRAASGEIAFWSSQRPTPAPCAPSLLPASRTARPVSAPPISPRIAQYRFAPRARTGSHRAVKSLHQSDFLELARARAFCHV